ncbi:hypothetical protein J1N10_04555 [Carboxylicivirga sp. A043]|uniref:hypothetical protein n=1 Tax=Carboxylicivirga litoralis TaxID=2816963 RepID=UPI0021CB2944|nr:hypothetical protein [Carboxylicivirga sp. A043]MCU4155233.1 hypothetical protein [Carboxylicivirga sp. A043]
MASKINQKVKENYDFYSSLLSERKSIFSEVIEINETGNNENTLSKQEVLKHKSIPDKMVLIVDVKYNNHRFFQFKLRYKEYIPQPFFRFDSDGDTHRNRIDGVPLSEQSITTPHFHQYNNDGVEIAFKTDKLINEKECKALEDINLCIAHFFQVSNTRLNNEDYPSVKISSDKLAFSFKDDDPNQNVTFP